MHLDWPHPVGMLNGDMLLGPNVNVRAFLFSTFIANELDVVFSFIIKVFQWSPFLS
jgi:hypothetical protein